MPKVKKLGNGMQLIFVPNKATEAASLMVFVKVGSRFESPEEAGISHFLEHLLFDGTKNRPAPIDIAKEIDGIGADFNAATTEEFTEFYITSASEHLEKSIEVLGDMISNSLLAPDQIAKEKGVVLEEIKMYEDKPASYIHNVFSRAIYGGNSLGRDVIGSRETVTAIDQKKIVEFMRNHYLPANFTVVVAGNFQNQDRLEKLIQKSFNLPESKIKKNLLGKFKQEPLGLQIKETSQTHLMVGYPIGGFSSTDRVPLKVLAVILGGNMSSRMFTHIREKKGLAYSISTYTSHYGDIGDLSTYAGVAHEKVEPALKGILDEYDLIKSNLNSKEVESAKSFIIGQAKINFEDSRNVAQINGINNIYLGRPISSDEFIKMVENVKLEEVEAAAKKYLLSDKLTVAFIGPAKIEGKIRKIISRRR